MWHRRARAYGSEWNFNKYFSFLKYVSQGIIIDVSKKCAEDKREKEKLKCILACACNKWNLHFSFGTMGKWWRARSRQCQFVVSDSVRRYGNAMRKWKLEIAYLKKNTNKWFLCADGCRLAAVVVGLLVRFNCNHNIRISIETRELRSSRSVSESCVETCRRGIGKISNFQFDLGRGDIGCVCTFFCGENIIAN